MNTYAGVIEAHVFKGKKQNLTGLILLTCYWHMCCRIIASGHQNKVYRFPSISMTWDPVRRLIEIMSTREV